MGKQEKQYKDHKHLLPTIRTLPDKPGVYIFYSSTSSVLYIGKAKRLKKRVASYFNKDKFISGKLTILVRKIDYIEYILVDSELDALLLENNLIKKHQPRYNIQLKDDKTFPWLCIKNERFPRLFPTRTYTDDGSDYFGPYASVRVMNNLLDLIRQLYPLRTCNHKLSEKNIKANKFKVCLQYHIKNCKGPCEGLQHENDYKNSIRDIKNILKGNISLVIKTLKGMMERYVGELEFEKAHAVKQRLLLLEKFQSKSTIVNPKIKDVDVFSIFYEGKRASVNYLKVINGAIVQSHNIEVRNVLEESKEDIMHFMVNDLRTRFYSKAAEVILPFQISLVKGAEVITVPQRGDKLKLLELSQQNLKYFVLETRKKLELIDPERHTKRIMDTMKKDLSLSVYPDHIECFDNSNLQGSEPVAAVVVFRNGKPSKSEYRHFNVRTVEGADDYASMSEIVFRRYSRLLQEEKDLPQLIIVDGGKGQLNAAVKSLDKLKLRGKIAIIGIAKKLEEIYYPDDPLPLHIDKTSETLRVIQHARNEAHRFGITHHRGKREKSLIKTELTNIKGIGKGTSKKLLTHFRSVKKIKLAKESEIAALVGTAKARIVKSNLK